MFKTEYRANTANPVWNHCHLLDSGSYNTSSSISFVILDADLKTIDDIIGVGCTTAATGSREIDLEGPAAADESNRGRLKVEIFCSTSTPSRPKMVPCLRRHRRGSGRR